MPYVLVPAPAVERRLDAVRALQHALYRAAKAGPERRFHALYDKVHRRDVLQRAWSQVRRNNGTPGIERNRRCTQAPPGLEGETEHRR